MALLVILQVWRVFNKVFQFWQVNKNSQQVPFCRVLTFAKFAKFMTLAKQQNRNDNDRD